MKTLSTSLAVSMALIALAASEPARAIDAKAISPAVCQPYTSVALDPALLRIRADGIANNYDTYRYVICPLPKDADEAWGTAEGVVQVWFRKGGAAPLSQNQCTMTAGWAHYANLVSMTASATDNGDPVGAVSFDPTAFPVGNDNNAVLVCRIAPKHKLETIFFMEGEFTETNI